MTHRRTAWTQLVRYGVPEFILTRPVMITGGVISPVGTKISLADLSLPKLRGLYEHKRIDAFVADETAEAATPEPGEAPQSAPRGRPRGRKKEK